ncbi:MAG: glycosyltransferase [Synechococcaceae cyanobacterium]|nr:glycosyltransferase [Synechococcaceae cyanobacterium]
MTQDEVFIGITSWNSERFLPTCLEAIQRTTQGVRLTVGVVDNESEDRSASIAKKFGAQVVVQQCSQQDAINQLIRLSRAETTLLIHSDVVLLDPHWLSRCRAQLVDGIALVSPEDIGCGPMTRPFGIGKPESSFLFFDTSRLRRCRRLRWHWPRPRRELDLSSDHLTHGLPALLAAHNFSWKAMRVYASNPSPNPLYHYNTRPPIWSDELAYLRYGLGNFYAIDNAITHYHNWYDRAISTPSPGGGSAFIQKQKREFPSDFIDQYSQRFLEDYAAGALDLPNDLLIQRTPRAL